MYQNTVSNTLAAYRIFVADEAGEELEPAATICEHVLRERVHQLKKWGKQLDRTQFEWAVIEMEELGEVAREIFDITLANPEEAPDPEQYNDLRSEWVQVAAVAIAAIEALDNLCDGRVPGYGEVVRTEET